MRRLPASIMLLAAICGLLARCEQLRRRCRPRSEYQVTIWRVEDGLPQSTVTSIAQGADGYLWLGTQNGLGAL